MSIVNRLGLTISEGFGGVCLCFQKTNVGDHQWNFNFVEFRKRRLIRGGSACSAMESSQSKAVTTRPLVYSPPPDIWGPNFVDFTPGDILVKSLSKLWSLAVLHPSHFKVMKEYEQKSEPLQKKVRMMLMDDSMDVPKKMSLIDVSERIGIYYLYENEINQEVDRCFSYLSGIDFSIDYDLHTIASMFRAFRQHGYKIHVDVFRKFVDSNGKIKESLKSDVKGMISLYEACHLRIHGEPILDDALAFASEFLESISTFFEQAYHALKQPSHFGIPRIESRHYISVYERDESCDETLLQLAKIEFNRLQLLYRQELSQLQKWWYGFDFTKKLPYVRLRYVECHLWTIGIFYETKYSFARSLLFRVFLLITILDDTYDAHGTLEELQQLTEAFERWDVSAVKQFPKEYMKVVFEFGYHIFEEFAMEMTKNGKPYAAQYAKQEVIKMIRSYYIEAEWFNANYIPTFEEYLINARGTTGIPFVSTIFIMGMENIVNEESFELIMKAIKAIKASEIISRLTDDIVTHEEEQARGDAASSVECYMKQYNISRQEVVIKFNKMIQDAWKDLNEELLNNPTSISGNELSRFLLDRIINFSRVVHFLYKDIDGFTHSAKAIKEDITTIYNRTMPI